MKNKQPCSECDGFKDVSSCCNWDMEEGVKITKTIIKKKKEEVYFTGSGKFNCLKCGRFCTPITCGDCWGTGYE